ARDHRTVRISGSRTKSYLGDVGPTDIDLSTARLSGVVDHVPADLTVTVGAGTRVAELQAALARAGQFLPLDPPHGDEATIGGVIAANSNGFWRARYGAVRDLLIGTHIALADGTVARAGGRVVKNVAGYDLARMRGLPARAIDGALVRVALPLAAAAAFAETASRLETLAVLVTDAAGGVGRAHFSGDDDAVIRDAEALLLAARVVGGSGRIERRAEHLRARLSTWPTRPNGDFLMRRIKEAFDPERILEPGRAAFA